MCLNNSTVLGSSSCSSWSYTTVRRSQREHRCRPATAAVEKGPRWWSTSSRHCCTLCCSSGLYRPSSTHGLLLLLSRGRLLQSTPPVWTWRCSLLKQSALGLPLWHDGTCPLRTAGTLSRLRYQSSVLRCKTHRWLHLMRPPRCCICRCRSPHTLLLRWRQRRWNTFQLDNSRILVR